jgi:hypothetical protein
MAEVSVDGGTGVITVHRVVCAVDCGPAVYPDAIVAQMEGGVVMGLSIALHERVKFARGGVGTSGFSQYRLLGMKEVPAVKSSSPKAEIPSAHRKPACRPSPRRGPTPSSRSREVRRRGTPSARCAEDALALRSSAPKDKTWLPSSTGPSFHLQAAHGGPGRLGVRP